MNSDGDVEVVSGAGSKGTSRMALSGGKGLGPEGAQRLAELLREAPPPMLEAMDLRCLYPLPLYFPHISQPNMQFMYPITLSSMHQHCNTNPPPPYLPEERDRDIWQYFYIQAVSIFL